MASQVSDSLSYNIHSESWGTSDLFQSTHWLPFQVQITLQDSFKQCQNLEVAAGGGGHVLSRTPAAGNLLGLAISPVLMAALGWRALFLVFGIMGAPLLAVWLGVVPARATLARQVPDSASARCSTLDLLRSSATWAIIVRPCTQLPCNFAACSSPHHCRSETGRGPRRWSTLSTTGATSSTCLGCRPIFTRRLVWTSGHRHSWHFCHGQCAQPL